MFDLSVLKETMKLEDDEQKVYTLVFPKKSVSVYFHLTCIPLLR